MASLFGSTDTDSSGLFSPSEKEDTGLFAPKGSTGSASTKMYGGMLSPQMGSAKIDANKLIYEQRQADIVKRKSKPSYSLFGEYSGPSFISEPPETIAMDSVSSRLPKAEVQGLVSQTMDLLFGSELAILGIAHDSDGWSWSVDNMMQQWSEQPLWVNALAATSLVGTMLVPSALAVRSSMKFGTLAGKAGRLATEVDEIAKWKAKGLLADQSISSYSQLGGNYEKTVKLLRTQEVSLDKFTAMKERARKAAEGLKLSPFETAQHEFEKRFSQTYNAMIGNAQGGDIKSQFHSLHDNLWKNNTIGEVLGSMPEESSGPAIYAYIMSRMSPNISKKGLQQFGKLSPEDKKWADMYYEAAKSRQADMLEDGFISPETFKSIGEVHLPAQYKGTADPLMDVGNVHMVPVRTGTKVTAYSALTEQEVPRTGLGKLFGKTKKQIVPTDEYQYVGVKLATKPRLSSPTMLHRSGTTDEIYDRLVNGNLITDPADLTVRGLMTDGLLHTNFKFVRDLALNPNNVASAADMAAWGGNATKAAKAGFVSLDYAGEHASSALRRMIAKASGRPEEPLPWIRKEIYDEIFGPNGMMAQSTSAAGDMMDVWTTIYKTSKTAGSIPTHLQNLTGNMIFLSQAGFNPVAPENVKLMGSLTGAFSRIADIQKAAKEANLGGRSLFDPTSGLLKGVDLGEITVNGKKFNLNKEMFDPVMKELLEESAFETMEGSGHIVNILGRLREDQYATRNVIKGYLKVKDMAQLGGKAKWFDSLTKAYLGEDMVPKMAYYMKLRGDGLSAKAAATEVARRLPMYGTVGSAIKSGRKFAFPWATFPAEAMRITKNNIMDYPIRMVPWLRAPQIMQSIFSGMGFAEGREGVEEAKRGLPFWAQKSNTIVAEGGPSAIFGGAASGGLIGGAIGAAAAGSAAGGYKGAAVGAAFGGVLAALTTDKEHESQLRGAVMDFLPHSTFMLTTNSVDFGGEYLPFRDVRGMLEQSPAEPLAILKPLVSVFAGETPFGEPVGGGTLGGGLAKTLAGAIGFLAPPLLQKYGFKLTTPDVPLWGDFTGTTNVAKGLIDTGNAIDPMTGMPGSMSQDFLLNNFGVWKSWASSAPQQLANEQTADKNLSLVRSNLTKNLAYHLENGNEKEAVEILSKVQATFANQYVHDPLMATNKYTEWITSHAKEIGRHPKLRKWSEEDLIARLKEAGELSGYARSAARQQLIEALKTELALRRGGRK